VTTSPASALPSASEFVAICREIVSLGRTDAVWSARESDDEFQSASYVGGYDGTESEFCFSVYMPDRTEFWFQISALDVSRVANGLGETVLVSLRPASAAHGA
jgi:hypothetical protein